MTHTWAHVTHWSNLAKGEGERLEQQLECVPPGQVVIDVFTPLLDDSLMCVCVCAGSKVNLQYWLCILCAHCVWVFQNFVCDKVRLSDNSKCFNIAIILLLTQTTKVVKTYIADRFLVTSLIALGLNENVFIVFLREGNQNRLSHRSHLRIT